MKAIAKSIAGRASWVPEGARLILVAHDISSPEEATYSPANSTPPILFERQLSFLQKKFTFVTLQALLTEECKKPRASLTFDDGFLTVGTRAEPILRRLGIPFTIFSNAKALMESRLDYGSEYAPLPFEKTRLYLNASELKHLHDLGAAIGSHGFSHQSLGGLATATLEKEILDNKNFLEGLIDGEVPDFAFPFGKARHISEAAIEICRRAGHKRIYSAEARYAEPGMSPIPRASLHLQDEASLHLLLNRMAISALMRPL